MISYVTFLENLAAVRARIATACQKCGRTMETVGLLPVTKTHSFEAAQHVFNAGIGAVGENRVQEAAEKRALAPAGLRWELIGHLQSNKTKTAVATFDRIQSVDSLELAVRIDRLCQESGKVMPVLLQANAGADPAKFGTADFDGLRRLAEATVALHHVRVEGLMTIPALDADLVVAQRAFETLRIWRDQLEVSLGKPLPELSMGMSGDMEVAIAAGSTMVRVGTALFGQR